MKDLFYEARPFAIGLAGMMSMFYSYSGFMTFAGLVLLACASLIIHARFKNRGII